MAKPTALADTTSYTIPTKRFDGGGGTLPQSSQPFDLADRESEKTETRPLQEDQDAFARYSNDVFRMKELLLFPEESADDDLDAVAKINEAFRDVGLSGPLINASRNRGATPPKRRKGNSTKPVAIEQQGSVRKTRLSYEIHPDLLMHDAMREIEAVENSHYIEEEGGPSLSEIASLFSLNANVEDARASVAVTVEDDDVEEDK